MQEFLEHLFPDHPIQQCQGLPGGLLYTTMIYSLKEADIDMSFALRKAGFTVPRSFILRGRSNLVKLRKNETVMITEMVEFVVENKNRR